MYIHQVPSGTKFMFKFDESTSIEGTFDGNIDHLTYKIFCPEIARNVDYYIESEPETEFFHAGSFWNFKSLLVGVTSNREVVQQEAIEFKVISPIKETKQRVDFRIQIKMQVTLHTFIDDPSVLYANGWVCDAISDDISKSGIRIFSDYALTEPLGTVFTLGFTLKNNIYMIPATLIRNSPNTTTRSYHYDQGFSFNFTDMEDRQEKLILDILEHKIKHRM
ncbi:MAG: PilZ domain-containing protein [Defluviitaleaceae bacterium]|nr:PilZ domain-containing protein [Defluviitaleaceae bacterium]